MGGPLTTDLNPSAYDAFAPFYDGFMAASDYESWTAQILELAARHGLAGRSVLDVACGTGKSLLPLRRRGYDVTGCNFSPAMPAGAPPDHGAGDAGVAWRLARLRPRTMAVTGERVPRLAECPVCGPG